MYLWIMAFIESIIVDATPAAGKLNNANLNIGRPK